MGSTVGPVKSLNLFVDRHISSLAVFILGHWAGQLQHSSRPTPDFREGAGQVLYSISWSQRLISEQRMAAPTRILWKGGGSRDPDCGGSVGTRLMWSDLETALQRDYSPTGWGSGMEGLVPGWEVWVLMQQTEFQLQFVTRLEWPRQASRVYRFSDTHIAQLGDLTPGVSGKTESGKPPSASWT